MDANWIASHKFQAAAGGGIGLALLLAVAQRFRSKSSQAPQTPGSYLIPNSLVSGGSTGEVLTITGPGPVDMGPVVVTTPTPAPTTPVPATPVTPVWNPPPVQSTQPLPVVWGGDTGLPSSLFTAPGEINDFSHWTSGAAFSGPGGGITGGAPITVDAFGVYHS